MDGNFYTWAISVSKISPYSQDPYLGHSIYK